MGILVARILCVVERDTGILVEMRFAFRAKNLDQYTNERGNDEPVVDRHSFFLG